jgi:hypothetical protein
MEVSRVTDSNAEQRLLLVGCGLLQREIACLAEKNHWPLDLEFHDAGACHDLTALGRTLCQDLGRNSRRPMVVFYGECHPRMDTWIAGSSAVRTEGRNCAEMLLGPERHREELAGGAYFLFEGLARRWENALTQVFGPNRAVAREIFRGSHSYALGVKTPCSGNYSSQAEAAAESVGLPLRWAEVSLNHLETVLQTAFDRASRGFPCPTQ